MSAFPWAGRPRPYRRLRTGAVARRAALRLHELGTGRRVLTRLDELNRTQWLSHAELEKLQREKLQQVVDYAYQYVPFYQRSFKEAGFHPDDLREDLGALSRLPIITKATIRENLDEMLTTEPERRKQLSRKSTSGSTGIPLVFMQDHNFRDYVTAGIQHHMGWGGWEMGQPQALIWGASFETTWRASLRDRMVELIWNRIQTNAFVLTEASMAAFAERVRRARPKTLLGYASSLHRFAQFARQSSFRDITFNAVFSTSEVLLPSVRQYIEETFGCKMFNRYATLELGDLACECEAHTGLHASMENNYVEILPQAQDGSLRNGHAAQPGEVGDVVVTNLNNLGMPFIRYSIGDASAWYTGDECPCGRAAPMLGDVQGRIVDSFKTRDGRTAWAGFAGAGYVGLAHPSIKQFQVVQKALDLMVVRLVTDGEVPQPTLDGLTETIQKAFGENVEVRFEYPDEIPALASGKHRYAFSELQEEATTKTQGH